jgi:hypothetical protein
MTYRRRWRLLGGTHYAVNPSSKFTPRNCHLEGEIQMFGLSCSSGWLAMRSMVAIVDTENRHNMVEEH